MTKNEIINLYIADLNSQVTKSDARDNRISMLQSELESTKSVDVVLADVRLSLPSEIEAAYNAGIAEQLNYEMHEVSPVSEGDYKAITAKEWYSEYIKGNEA